MRQTLYMHRTSSMCNYIDFFDLIACLLQQQHLLLKTQKSSCWHNKYTCCYIGCQASLPLWYNIINTYTFFATFASFTKCKSRLCHLK